jgi:hypothetical protein
MLHADPLMCDIDVDQWRNLQSLLLDSAKGRRRVVLVHEDGEVLKLVHSHREALKGKVSHVADPHETARQLYFDNAGKADFVAVFERRAFDEYFGRWQGTWRADEDLDDFVHRTYEMISEYPDGLVTYPGEARHTLGLQWRLGASHEKITRAVHEFVPPGSTVVFGIFDQEKLWATLVLGFDEDLKVRVVTTADVARLPGVTSREAVARSVVEWAEAKYPPCSIGLFTSLPGAQAFVSASDKGEALRRLSRDGDLVAGPLPEALIPLAIG